MTYVLKWTGNLELIKKNVIIPKISLNYPCLFKVESPFNAIGYIQQILNTPHGIAVIDKNYSRIYQGLIYIKPIVIPYQLKIYVYDTELKTKFILWEDSN